MNEELRRIRNEMCEGAGEYKCYNDLSPLKEAYVIYFSPTARKDVRIVWGETIKDIEENETEYFLFPTAELRDMFFDLFL